MKVQVKINFFPYGWPIQDYWKTFNLTAVQWFLCLKHPQLSILVYFFVCFCANITLFFKDICIFILLFYIFWLHLESCEIPRPEMKPTSPAMEAQSLNLWTTREVLYHSFNKLYNKSVWWDRSFDFFPQDCLDYADPLNFCIKSFRMIFVISLSHTKRHA